MRKVYTEKDYANMAVEANLNNKLIEVFTDIIRIPIYDDKDKIIGYDKEEIENIRLVDNPVGLSMLKMTPLDFLKAIEQYGITYDMVKQFMEQNPLVERELRFCQFVYRKHPMLQSLSEYGITSEVLDTIFRKANGEDV